MSTFSASGRTSSWGPSADVRKMSSAELINEISKVNEFSQYDTKMPKKDIIIKLNHLQRTRHLMRWHGGATLAGHGYILITFSELYNPALHYRDDEFSRPASY